VIGTWLAGSVEEGLAFYRRKYDDLAAEVRLLEDRIKRPDSDTKSIAASARKLAETIPNAAAIGDLASLTGRLSGVLEAVEARRAEAAEQRAAAAAAAADRKRGLVEEARALATSDSWRASSDRFRAIVDEWKTIHGVDRAVDSQLWEQLSTARREFDKRRRAAAAAAEVARADSAERKQALVKQAQKLAASTEWAETARKFRDLMTAWKAAGRASREADDELWAGFKAAQDQFFTARSEAFSARDDEQRANLEAKQQLLADAEGIDPTGNPDAARKQLRKLQDRWDAVGHVPRESISELEDRMAAVEDRLRDAANAGRKIATTESPLVIRLRESVGKLENRLQRALTAGDTKLADETEAALATQREWLAQAESTR